MRVLFLMRNHGYITHYESTIRELANRGHEVFIGSRGAERHYAADMNASMERLCSSSTAISVHRPPRRRDEWAPLAEITRSIRNYCRYYHPRYADASELRARAAEQVSRVAGRMRLPAGRMTAAAVGAVASAIERRIPIDPEIEAAIHQVAPDVVVATPLVDFNSFLPDYVAAAARLRIPTVWAVASWDNLTNKGLVGRLPDRVLVWNDAQRDEASSLQGVPADRIRVTGAQTFDPWFELTPSVSRDELCSQAGLPAAPYILYLCSSLFIAPNEPAFVTEWLTRLRATSGALRNASVLIRPHPATAALWASADLKSLGPVSLWPRAGDLPIDAEARQRYFDCLYHASLLVGVNSSSMIEGGVVGRRSYTLLAPEFAHAQRGTLHFDHLTRYGFVTTARDWAEHFAQLEDAFTSTAPLDDERRQRMMSFVRPQGARQRSMPLVVEAIEDAANLPVPAISPIRPGRVMARLASAATRSYKKARELRRSRLPQ